MDHSILQVQIKCKENFLGSLIYDGSPHKFLNSPAVQSSPSPDRPHTFQIYRNLLNEYEVNYIAWYHWPDYYDGDGNVWPNPVVLSFTTFGKVTRCAIGYADPGDAQPNNDSIRKGTMPTLPFGSVNMTDPTSAIIEIDWTDIPPVQYQYLGSGHPFWITDLMADPRASSFKDKPLSWLHIPGTHQSACNKNWGSVSKFANSQTQELDLYEQCMLGIRCFDLRLFIQQESNPIIVKARHGASTNASLHVFSEGTNMNPNETLIGKLDAFYNQIIPSTSEFVLLLMRGEDDSLLGGGTISQHHVNLLWESFATYFEHIEHKAIQRPEANGSPPKLGSIAGSSARFILIWEQDQIPDGGAGQDFFNKYAWRPGNGVNREGLSPLNFDNETYKSGDIDKVTNFIEGHLEKANAANVSWARPKERQQFFVTQCQLTPSTPPTTPWSLVASNIHMGGYNLRKDFWIRNTNILSFDYPTGALVERILWMNYQLLMINPK